MYYSDGDSEGSEDTYGEDERVIEELTPFLSNSTCACGGTVLVGKKADQCQDNITEPVVIRWDAGNLTKRLTLPLPPVTAEKSGDATLQGLIDDMEPASFGFQGKDIVDDSYRKAVKLDTSAFTTSFCPYKVGIVDTLGHALLPIRKAPFQGIYADLYKLNVSRIVLMGTTAIANLAMYIYEGPSGIFKPHVDTPRSELQFGSLVVCLPSAHKGGQLVVRHQGYSTVFDWANNSPNIQWAAFYGDCKHEVKQVVSGHRVTLTYNLYWRRGVGEMCGFNTTLNIKELPAYREMVKALSNPLFFAEGGTFGRACSHAYAHTTDEGIRSLPGALKGSDMVLFDIRPHLNYFDYSKELNPDHCDSHWIGKKLSVPRYTDSGGCEEENMDEVLAEFPTEKGRIKWSQNSDIEEEMQFAHLRYGNQAEIDFA